MLGLVGSYPFRIMVGYLEAKSISLSLSWFLVELELWNALG